MSPPETITLTELERDALTELINLGVSRAAVSLREMVGEQVYLSVPSVDLSPISRRSTSSANTGPKALS